MSLRVKRSYQKRFSKTKNLATGVDSYTEGNPFLQPSFSNNFELGYTLFSRYSFTLFSQRVTDASGFVSLVDTVHNGFFFQQQNMGQISNVGLTASSTFEPAHWLETSVQLNGYYSRFTSSYADNTKGVQYAKPSLYIETNQTIYFNRSKTFASEVNLWYQAPQQLGYNKERAQYNLGVACKAMFLEKRLIFSLVTYDLLATTKQRAVNQYNGTIINIYYDDRSARLSVTYKFGRKEIKGKRERKEGGAEEGRRTN